MKEMYLKHESKILDVLRVLIGAVFLLSAIGKLYPSPQIGIALFENKTLLPSGFSQEAAYFFSRALVILEIFIGLMLLKRRYFAVGAMIARVVLGIFTAYLIYVLFTDGNSEDCGCFGSLFAMSTRASLWKNIIIVWILQFLISRNTNEVSLGGLSTLFYVVSISVLLITPMTKIVNSGSSAESVYSHHFESLNEGVKILCFFSPDCEHCKETGKQLGAIDGLPDVRIIFADEGADKIPEFFKFTGLKAKHKVISLEEFAEEFFIEHDVPGVLLLENGHPIHFFDGIDENAYNDKLFRELIDLKRS
jgi:uncharacterized membrane protein YphA (DoxX/SURF4 family)